MEVIKNGKADIELLQDLFKVGYETFLNSRMESAEVMNLYHNRQYTPEQISKLKDRGQPAETFNVVKFFGRLILGYYSTVVNTVKAEPEGYEDIATAGLLNDVIDHVMRSSRFETEGDKIKLDGLLQGLMCVYEEVIDTGKRDMFGRAIRKIINSHVPAEEIVIDPMSVLEDYSDASWIHRFKWLGENKLRNFLRSLGDKIPDKTIARLDAYDNHLDIEEAEFEYKYNDQFDGYFRKFNNYLIVHTVIEDNNGKRWSIFWSGDIELGRKEITFNEVRFPYRVHKIHTSNKAEYYGIFREVVQSQHAINQALLKIQLMVNTQKAFVEKGGVDNLSEFTDQINRVNAVIPVKSLKKIKIENITREVMDQYSIIDRALDRIQRVLGVNDSFLGMAFASDSGRKVKLQQNASSLALRYVSLRIEQFYRLLGWDIANLIKQFYTATQALKITDDVTGYRWAELNKPLMEWTGRINEQGQPLMDFVYEEVLDPESGEVQLDERGNIILAPVPQAETDISFTNVDISIDSVIYNDEDEKNQLMLETILQGNIGNTLLQVNPAGYLKASSLAVKSMKSKHSIDIAQILDQTGMMLGQNPGLIQQQEEQPKSQTMNLPQNTNEPLDG